MVADLQQQSKGQLRNGIGAVPRHVADDNAAPPRRSDIHNVAAGRQDADEPQVRRRIQKLGAERRLVGEDDFGVSDPRGRLAGSGTVIDRQFAQRGKLLPGEIARIQGETVENCNFHIASFFGGCRFRPCRMTE